MKKKIFTLVICFVLIVATVFTTLHISNVYDFRKELIGVIERDSDSFFGVINQIEVKKLVDIIELDDTVITVCTVLEKYEKQDKILIAFFDKTNPAFSLEDLWVLSNYKSTNEYFNVKHQYVSDDSIFLSFSRTNKIKVRKDNYTYKDYKIDAYNRKENYTLSYRVSTEVEYPIYMKYYDYGFASYNSTNVVSLFIDRDDVLYIATIKKNQNRDYDDEVEIKTSKDFEEVYKKLKINKKQLDKQMVGEIYNSFLQISKHKYYATDSDDMVIRIGDCKISTTVSDYHYELEGTFGNSAYYAQSGLFKLLDRYFTYEDIDIKFGEY